MRKWASKLTHLDKVSTYTAKHASMLRVVAADGVNPKLLVTA